MSTEARSLFTARRREAEILRQALRTVPNDELRARAFEALGFVLPPDEEPRATHGCMFPACADGYGTGHFCEGCGG